MSLQDKLKRCPELFDNSYTAMTMLTNLRGRDSFYTEGRALVDLIEFRDKADVSEAVAYLDHLMLTVPLTPKTTLDLVTAKADLIKATSTLVATLSASYVACKYGGDLGVAQVSMQEIEELQEMVKNLEINHFNEEEALKEKVEAIKKKVKKIALLQNKLISNTPK